MSKRATSKYGALEPILDCYIDIPGDDEFPAPGDKIEFYIMPDISDSKGATYGAENLMGRSFPVKTYSHSDERTINLELHFISLQDTNIDKNLGYLNLIRSAVYQRTGDNKIPYKPPGICKIKCGQLLGNNEICAVLKNYSVKFPIDQVIDETTLLPYKFDVSTTWEVVYASSDLPGAGKIISDGM